MVDNTSICTVTNHNSVNKTKKQHPMPSKVSITFACVVDYKRFAPVARVTHTVKPPNKEHLGNNINSTVVSIVERLSFLGCSKCIKTLGKQIIREVESVLCREVYYIMSLSRRVHYWRFYCSSRVLIQHVQPKDEEKINDLNEEIESAARASWVKLFHKDTADRTKDEQNALVCAKGW